MKGTHRKRKVNDNYKDIRNKESGNKFNIDIDDETICDDHIMEIQPQRKLKKYTPLVSEEFNIDEHIDDSNSIMISNLVTTNKCARKDNCQNTDVLACERGVSKISLNSTCNNCTVGDGDISDDSIHKEIKSDSSDVNDNVKGILRKSDKKNTLRRKSVSFDGITDEQLKDSHIYPKDKFQKLKKKKKKKKFKKTLDTKCTSQRINSEQITKIEKASNYLNAWKYNKEEWKFEKLLQSWIIKHMFNVEQITCDTFEILLEYMMNIRGAARELAIEYSQKVIKDKEISAAADDVAEDKNLQDDAAYQRARSLLQYIQ